jgi:hypothetical protein
MQMVTNVSEEHAVSSFRVANPEEDNLDIF